MARVLVTVPTTGYIHKHVVMALGRIQTQNVAHELQVIFPTHRPFENNLHHILVEFLEGKHDYWLSIDADNPPMGNPLDLVSLDLDLVGCPTPVWHYTGDKPGERPIYWNAYKAVPEHGAYTEWPTKEGLQEVDAIGTGCFLVARRVIADLVGKHTYTGMFSRTFDIFGRVEKGNDIAFCERVKAEGFKIHAHYDYPCMHFNELELTEVIRAFKGLGIK